MKRIALAFIALSLVLSLCSCSLITSKITDAIGDKIGEVAGEKLLGEMLGGDVKLNDDGSFSFEGEDGSLSYSSSWPESGLGALLPKYYSVDGEVTSGEADGSLYIAVSEVTREKFDSYIDDLIAAGYDVTDRSNDENNTTGMTIFGGNSSDGKYTVMLTYSAATEDSDKTGMIVLLTPVAADTETEA